MALIKCSLQNRFLSKFNKFPIYFIDTALWENKVQLQLVFVYTISDFMLILVL